MWIRKVFEVYKVCKVYNQTNDRDNQLAVRSWTVPCWEQRRAKTKFPYRSTDTHELRWASFWRGQIPFSAIYHSVDPRMPSHKIWEWNSFYSQPTDFGHFNIWTVIKLYFLEKYIHFPPTSLHSYLFHLHTWCVQIIWYDPIKHPQLWLAPSTKKCRSFIVLSCFWYPLVNPLFHRWFSH